MNTYSETIKSMEDQLLAADDERLGLIATKKEVEAEQSQITTEIRRNHAIPRDRWRKLLQRQGELKTTQSMLDAKLSEITAKRRKLNILIDACKRDGNAKQTASDQGVREIREQLAALKVKYTEFSTDGTRVASMRLMASKFVEEIDSALAIAKATGSQA